MALVLLRAERARSQTTKRVFPREMEKALAALATELRADVFLPLRRAQTVREAASTLAEVRAPFRALWSAIIETIFAGLALDPRSGASAVNAALRAVPALPSDLWTGRRAIGRLGRENVPFWAAAYDARAQAALTMARWPEGRPWPVFAPAGDAEVTECALGADLAITFALDVLAERRAVRLPAVVSRWLAREAHDNARKVFVIIATPLYRDAEARGR